MSVRNQTNESVKLDSEDAFNGFSRFASARLCNFTLELIGGSSLLLENYQILVNAANENLILGGGIAGEIRNRAGNGVQAECDAFKRENNIEKISSGQICITGAYNLKNYLQIYHTVGPKIETNQVTDKDKIDLFNSVLICIYQAIASGANSIVIPAISVGIFSFPIEEAVVLHYNAFFNMVNLNPDVQLKVCFCLYKKFEMREFYNFMRTNYTSFDSVQFYEENV